MSEFIYILENRSMPGMVKIGRTDRKAVDRASELSCHTGVPTEFVVVKEYAVADATAAELQVHERLAEYRISNNREFFKLSADEAIEILDSIFLIPAGITNSSFEQEDEMLAAATELAIIAGSVYPGIFAGAFKISYEEAERIINALKARGVLNEQNDLRADWKMEHELLVREEAERLRRDEKKNRALMELHYGQIQIVKQIFADLRDPETGEAPEISFDRDGNELVVEVKGSEWLETEAQKRLALAFPRAEVEHEKQSDAIE